MSVLPDGRVRFSAWAFPGLDQLDFGANHGSVLPDDSYAYDAADYVISVRWRGRSIFYLYLARHRVQSTCFAYDLSPDDLREAVALLRDAGSGIERWIAAGLEWAHASPIVRKDNPEAWKLIPALLESVRDLPVAKAWKRQREQALNTDTPAGKNALAKPRRRAL